MGEKGKTVPPNICLQEPYHFCIITRCYLNSHNSRAPIRGRTRFVFEMGPFVLPVGKTQCPIAHSDSLMDSGHHFFSAVTKDGQ